MEDQENQEKMNKYLQDLVDFHHIVKDMNEATMKLFGLMVQCTQDENHFLYEFAIRCSSNMPDKVKLDMPFLEMYNNIPLIWESEDVRNNWLRWSPEERSQFFLNLSGREEEEKC